MKKVLIITYYWPPAGGPGVQRILKFVKYLPQFGWSPIVLTVKYGEYPALDNSLINEVSSDLPVYRTNTREPFRIYKKLTSKSQRESIPNLLLTEQKSSSWRDRIAKWLRTNVFIPDARLGWISYIVKDGMRIIEKEKPDLIFSSSPPHSLQLGSMRLARKSGLKWVVDFRDLWFDLEIFYQHNKRTIFSSWLDSRMEKKVLRGVDGIVSNNDYAINLFMKKIHVQKPFAIIPSGYDEHSFKKLKFSVSQHFRIAYAGTLSESRVPRILIRALKNIDPDRLAKIKLQFLGTVCDSLRTLIEDNDLDKQVEYIGYVAYQDLIKNLEQATVVLLVVDNVPHNLGFLQGKLFDYLGIKKPIYAIGPINHDTNRILHETDSGHMVDYEDLDAAVELLNDLITDWENRKTRYTFKSEIYQKKPLTQKLAIFFDEICAG
jgi:glycosyltransferase involved in cell wall biosynthesis